MKRCTLCWETRQDEFHTYQKTRCKQCIRNKQLAFNRANPEYLKAKNQRRRARKLALQNDLTPQQWKAILDRFDGKCALTDSSDVVLEHIIPLENMCGGTTIGNVTPMDATLNLSKRDRNFVDWVFEPEIEAKVDPDKLDNLLDYLAEVNGLTIEKYLDFVYWCERNERSKKPKRIPAQA
ncbi:hypothetical protein [Sporosarcina sp. HYO08]|uniref:hypothetical protein n=1 Tax=Sporosarcina sp. HYO08 TaxID=1759557 RepID=UPI00079C73A4|nr:hypothetical protein [Sporosarcina sp. HYO08]KXH86735.1 hypothetical protein AU377_14450 [Sporosarcina sp. HYO08]